MGQAGRQPFSYLTAAYWLLPLALGCVQLLVDVAAMNHIHSEELAESARNVYWLQHGLIYDGGSTNIGWYATLLFAYHLFGYGLFAAKFVRLCLHVIALYCAAELLRRCMGVKRGVVPLIALGLSPCLLYFNSFQTSNGMDLDYFVICGLLAASVRLGPANALELGKTFLAWLVAMFAAMTYPVFLFYLPGLAMVFAARFWNSEKTVSRAALALHGASAVAGLALPLLAALFLPSAQILIHDPATGSGLFRGGGKAGFDFATLEASIVIVLRDLFVRGGSYYFRLASPDFSGVLAMASVMFAVATSFYLGVMKKKYRPALAACLCLFLFNLIVPNTSVSGLPGLRRCTGILAAGYVAFAVAWDFWSGPDFRGGLLRLGALLLCLLLPASNALKIGDVLKDAGQSGSDPAQEWFAAHGNPAQSLAWFNSELEQGRLVLASRDAQGRAQPCEYWSIYSALAGYRLWNGLTNIDIKAVDWKTGQTITLAPSLWTAYYFPH